MKFIIAKSTVVIGNALNHEIALTIANAFGVPAEDIRPADDVVLTDEFENFSAKLVDGNYEFEMNDECVLKLVRLYAKAARIIMPFVKPVINLMAVLKSDMADIEEFIGKRKPAAEPLPVIDMVDECKVNRGHHPLLAVNL